MSLGLYVHIPFCSVKCYYCDFTAFSGQKAQIDRYLDALEAEARLHRGRVPETLYIGGGTPSELSTGQLERLMAILRGAFPGSRFIEATVEANPESLSPSQLRALRAGGIERLSLGLQTADDKLLREIGRRHTAADFSRVFAEAREAGFRQICVDLMYGLPGQTLKSLRASLDFVLGLEPEHLSLYGLQVEDRTLFGKRGVESDQDLGREMFEAALSRLAAAGYRHYEISNFAKAGHESRHNMNYWLDGEYIGLGCGAASYLDGVRSTNTDRLADYCGRALSGELPAESSERLAGKAKLGETILLGLRRLEGISINGDVERAFGGALGLLERRGLISRTGNRARLTQEGIFQHNQVALEFVEPFAEAGK